MVMSPKRKLLLQLRKTIKIQRRFKTEHAGGGRIRWTCLTSVWHT
jgi:hypothetical protein